MRRKSHYEIVSARLYYGRHALKSVLLRNGCVEYHGKASEAKRTLRNVKALIKGA